MTNSKYPDGDKVHRGIVERPDDAVKRRRASPSVIAESRLAHRFQRGLAIVLDSRSREVSIRALGDAETKAARRVSRHLKLFDAILCIGQTTEMERNMTGSTNLQSDYLLGSAVRCRVLRHRLYRIGLNERPTESRISYYLKAVLLCCLLASVPGAQYVEDSIDVGAGWVGSLAYNSRADVVYGECQLADVLFAISCDSNKVIQSIALAWPGDMTYDSVDNKGYVAFAGAEEDSLAVIDGSTHQVVKKIEMPGATTPVWDPVSDRLYVSCQSTNKVAVVDCATDSLLTYISVGACPLKLYINTLRRKLYVLNYDNGTVSIVNMATNQVIKTLVVGGTPNAGYYLLSVDKFYSAGAYGYCTVIDGAADSIVARIPLPRTSADMRSATGNEGSGLVYLGIHYDGGNCVATVRAQDDSLMANVTIGGSPWGIAYYGESGLVYSTSLGTNEVYIISGDGSQVLTTIPVGAGPYVFAVAPRHGRLYVGHENGPYIYVLRDTSAAVAEAKSRHHGSFRPLIATPNPFSRSVTVAWSFAAEVADVARIYAQDGRLVRQAQMSAGASRWVWDGRDDAGKATAPGVYVVGTGTGGRQKVVKLRQ